LFHTFERPDNEQTGFIGVHRMLLLLLQEKTATAKA
jgi:hypothetical protein